MNQVYILKHWSYWDEVLKGNCYDESTICYFLNKPNTERLNKHLTPSFHELFKVEDLLDNLQVERGGDDEGEGYFFEVEYLN